MELKTYKAHSMAAALEQVKKDLGHNAVILNTRTLKTGGVLGVGARTVIEVTASRDSNALSASERRAMACQERDGGAPESRTGDMSRSRPRRGSDVDPPRHDDAHSLATGLRDEMREIRGMVQELLHGKSSQAMPVGQPPVPVVPAEFQDYYTRLLQNAVAEELAREVIGNAMVRLADCRNRIMEGIAGRVDARQAESRIAAKLQELAPAVLMECLERMLPPAEPLQLDGQGIPKIMILVGPTGVGKTTTVAKLAAHFRLREGKRVGLITTDTYRIAAVDQLKAYADIMDLPLEVVFTPEELPASITRLCDCDLILIDTSGRNHRDVERMNELRAYLKAARLTLGGNMKKVRRKEGVTVSERRKRGRRRASETGVLKAENQHIEVHLLLSCTCHQDQLVQVAQNFGEVGVDKVVFTKLDEAVGFGVVLNVASRLKYRLSYLTTGQDVPDDIEPGHRRKIAEMLLKNGADRMILRQQPVEGCRGESVDRLA